MQIEIWSVGKDNEPHIEQGISYYFKKIRHYAPTALIVINPSRKSSTSDEKQIRQQEEAIILKRLQPHHYLIVLDERGKSLSSPEWAKQIENCKDQGIKHIVFLIGGAYGVTDLIRSKANQVWTLSKLVFPHQLVRLILAEQIYRSFSIMNRTGYHHD